MMPAYKLREIDISEPLVDPYEAAERAGVAVYGADWLTMAQLRAAPHTPSVAPWMPVGPEHEEPEPLPWVPAAAIERGE